MSQRFCRTLVVAACIAFFALAASGCAKKTFMREEVGARPAPVMEAKKEPPPPPAPAPRVEEAKPPVPPPAPPPKVEAAPPSPPETIDFSALRVQFAFDDSSLSNKSKENLKNLAGWMKRRQDVKVQVEGHTCDLGTNEYNLALSERRAISAKKFLESLGVPGNRISVIGYGEEKPLVPNSDENHRSRNRRDEFVQVK
ncbi:MAG TPA: OmpA family protein [Thermodesulfobacteriota bacterium]|nr:OmpA family protein [Thermodesulfobacteriota bacterium]